MLDTLSPGQLLFSVFVKANLRTTVFGAKRNSYSLIPLVWRDLADTESHDALLARLGDQWSLRYGVQD